MDVIEVEWPTFGCAHQNSRVAGRGNGFEQGNFLQKIAAPVDDIDLISVGALQFQMCLSPLRADWKDLPPPPRARRLPGTSARSSSTTWG